MHVRRTAYILFALAKGHRTLDELSTATTLSKEAIRRALKDHARKLSVKINSKEVDGELHYELEHWGMLNADWLWANERYISTGLDLPRIQMHPRNVMGETP